ncbi:hypothetical protein GPUN_0884 [Glaciecola punicea ACAM 611]|uniref:Uncharacterized protein n=1 Tax=Glaciecola punicea ACAM 611 TaxID=1121923 RepID=H5T9N9_9ALTE|nr:hypothetical protein [Glaciecola punicea]GAB55016.1 hypothetical protein GPUN_0884 [Glaciecola punicea ACAM 611]
MRFSIILIVTLFFGSVHASDKAFEKYSPPNCKMIAEWVDVQGQSKTSVNIKQSDYPNLHLYDVAIAIYISRNMPLSKSNTYASAYLNCRAIIAGNVVVKSED